jgi:hypothetical protein
MVKQKYTAASSLLFFLKGSASGFVPNELS